MKIENRQKPVFPSALCFGLTQYWNEKASLIFHLLGGRYIRLMCWGMAFYLSSNLFLIVCLLRGVILYKYLHLRILLSDLLPK